MLASEEQTPAEAADGDADRVPLTGSTSPRIGDTDIHAIPSYPGTEPHLHPHRSRGSRHLLQPDDDDDDDHHDHPPSTLAATTPASTSQLPVENVSSTLSGPLSIASSDELSMPAVVPPRQAPLSGRGGEGASLSGDELDRQTGLRGSPTRRHSSGKLGGLGAAFMDKLHFRPLTSASGGGGGGASGLIGRHSGPHSGKSSGKHTPTSREATGDFGEFLAAAELRAALEEEQKRAQKKAGVSPNKKQKRNSFGAGLGLTARTGHKGQGDRTSPRSEQSHSEVELGGAGPSAPPERTLADRKHFPGDLHHHGHIANPRISNGGMHHRSSSHTPALPRQSSARSRSERQRLERPLGPCGTAEFTSDSLTEESSDDEPSLLRDGLADEPDTGGRSVAGPSSRPLSRRASASSSASDDSLVTKAREVAREASTRSLKSWKSDGESMRSLASGGANPALSKPLLELEELELESFLKNFGRHTREVRVPASATFPQKRMPQWSDFRVPAGEGALAAAEGRRVTVLTRVDRGLQKLLEAEGAEGALRRSTSTTVGGKKGNKPSKMVKGSKISTAGPTGATTDETQHVTFAPQPALFSSQRSGGPIDRFASQRSSLEEKDERKAKREARHVEDQVEGREHNHKGKGTARDDPDYKPSRDELGLADGDWELINAGADAALEVQSDNEHVDGVAFCIAYILALVERYAPEELDNSPDQIYREGKIRSHIERLYLIAPFWERFVLGARRLYRWEEPRRTAAAAMIYFVLWYTDLIPTAFLLTIMFYIMRFRFFPPDASVLHDQVRKRMHRGVEADRLAERLRRRSRLDVLEIYRRWCEKYGVSTQIAAGDVADFHEKVKNLLLWRNPQATWRTLALFSIATAFVTFVPAHIVWKTTFFFLGLIFFALLPLQSHYPRYRRPLSPIWWALWGSPTDAQFAMQLLRRRHMDHQESTHPLHTTVKWNRYGLPAGTGADGSGEVAGQDGGLDALTDEGFRAQAKKDGNSTSGTPKSKPHKLGSFFCQHHGVPGHLLVTSSQLYFVALHATLGPGHSRKTCKTPLNEIAGLVKTKSIRLLVWSSSGLQVVRRNGKSMFFSNMANRDEAFNLLLAVSSSCWTKV